MATRNVSQMPRKIADPVEVDSKHYKVEFENDKVRVLRVKYGPGEKSPMHGHPDTVAVFLTPHYSKHQFSSGEKREMRGDAGSTMWLDACEHLPENGNNEVMELVLVELKR
jgi:quercetin dioxygenase-like cupin family protein